MTDSTTTPALRYAAFTDGGTGGNPAGVVLDAEGIDDRRRLAIAAEIGFSETAFAEPTAIPGRYRMRYFSPRAEVGFCGHATIAAAVAIAERDGVGVLRFDTAVGEVVVRTTADESGLSATLTSVATHTRPATADELAAALAALRYAEADLDTRYPPHVAYAGNDHLVLALRDRGLLAALDYDYAALDRLMAQRQWTTVHLVWAEDSVTFHARDPFPPGGVVEDPATGAAAAAFGGYLRALGLVPVPGQVVVRQGADMGRPSRLVIDLSAGEGGVDVTGTAAPI
jgi:PhzF family phenazine biosynthesis protein